MILARICKECGRSFPGGPRAYYCPPCRAQRARHTNALYRARKRAGDVREIGSADACERCGKTYVVDAGPQRFCPDCQRLHAMDYDRQTSIQFYREHKEIVNPTRNARRRIALIACKWCGQQFDPKGTVARYCSDECRRKNKNHSWMQAYRSKK